MIDKILEVILQVLFFFRKSRKAKKQKGEIDEED